MARGEISSAVTLSSRVYPLQIRKRGEPIYQGDVVIDAEKSPFITLFVMGNDNNVVVSTDPDYDGTVSLSTSLLRFVHANSDGPILYIYNPITEGTPMPENSTGRSDLISALDVNSVSSMLQTTAGTMQFGLMNAQNGQLLFTSEPLTFDGGQSYEILLMADDGGEGWKIIVIQRER